MGFKRNTNVVYDLISEGEISLVNGLSSIYLNKTPIVNSKVQHTLINKVFSASASGTALTFDYGTTSYKIDGWRPIRVRKGAAVGTVTTTAGSASVTSGASFFTSSMIASSTPAGGGLYQYIRIPGAGPGGSDYVGEVVAVASTTAATLYPAPATAVTGAEITFDHFSYAQINLSGATLSTACPRTGDFTIDVGAQSLELGATDASTMNFKFVRVSFRTGTLHQPPVKNLPGFSNASFGKNVGLTLLQHTDYHGSKLTNGRDTASEYATGGTTIDIDSDINLPVTADRVVLTITTDGLEGFKASSGAKGPVGLTVQIWFDYKTNAGDWAQELIYGPTDQQLAASKSYVWSAANNPLGVATTGDIKGHDTESQDHEFSFSIDQFKPFSQFKIRIKRVTPVNYKLGDFKYTNGTTVKSVQGFIDDKINYAYSGYAAIAYDSNEFEGNPPTRGYHCYGIPCWVPTNYVTRLEASDGVAKYTRDPISGDEGSAYVPWDGTFRKIYCDNPAWVLRTLLLENRFGLGNWLKPEHISSYSFYSMARRCDELVPDGEGNLEPRFICGVYLTQATEAYKIIKDFCSIMTSVPFWIDGLLAIEGDRPQEPIYSFHKGNIIGSLFSYESTGNKTRPNQIAVTFNDKNNFYSPTVELVDDVEDMIIKNRVYSEEAVAFGAVTRSQAIRYAKWKLLTSKLNREVISFRTSENAGYLKPGNVVRIQDADRYRVRNSGRISAATTTTVTLDKPITLSAGTYTLHVMVPGPATYLSQDSATIGAVEYVRGDQLPIFTEQDAEDLVDDDGASVEVTWSPDMHLENRTVTTSAGSGISVLTVGTAFSEAPQTEFVWALSQKSNGLEVEGSSKLYRILGIAEESLGTYAITAAEHYNEKFDALDEEYISEVNELVSNKDEIPVITGFTASVAYKNAGVESAGAAGTRTAIDIVLRWTPPKSVAVNGTSIIYPNLDKYILQYYTPLGELKKINISKSATSYTVENLMPGSYEFDIRAVNVAGASTVPIYTTVSASNNSEVPGTVNQLGLPRGGLFSVPPSLQANKIVAADDYQFTSPAGTTIEVVDGAI